MFSVQYHPEASPGPHDSHYLFTRFADMMRQSQALRALPLECRAILSQLKRHESRLS